MRIWPTRHCPASLRMVLERAGKAGVSQMICVAVDAGTASKAIAIAEANFNVWASVGIHPNYAHEATPEHWPRIVEYTKNPRVCALGETGLDRHWDDCPFEIQQANFERHWDLSRQTDLPLIIHMRDCELEMLAALRKAICRKNATKGSDALVCGQHGDCPTMFNLRPLYQFCGNADL